MSQTTMAPSPTIVRIVCGCGAFVALRIVKSAKCSTPKFENSLREAVEFGATTHICQS